MDEDYDFCTQLIHKMCDDCPNFKVCHEIEINHDAMKDCLENHWEQIKIKEYPIRDSAPEVSGDIFCADIKEIVELHNLLEE